MNEKDIETMLEMMEKFGFFFKLTKEEEILYEQPNGGYLFPSLRPKGQFSLKFIPSPPKLIASIMIPENVQLITSREFCCIQFVLREVHDKLTQIYCNGFRLHKDNNYATILLPNHSKHLQIIVQGPQPHQFMDEIVKNIRSISRKFTKLQFNHCYACPACVMKINGSIYELPSFVDIHTFNSPMMNLMKSQKTKRLCEHDEHPELECHLLSFEEITEGIQVIGNSTVSYLLQFCNI